MSAGLLEKLMKTSSVKGSSILSESKIFDNKDFIDTGIPIINLAFSGKIDGGLTNGITVVAAPSKHFKSLLALYCLKAFLNKHKDGVAILYDSEYGITPEYLAMYDIDPSRVLHVPVDNIEQLKFDCVKKLESIDGKKEKVFILIDSLGNMASKKEVDDAENENSVADMTRAKAIRSLFRIITPHIAKKNIPLFVVNATYASMDKYSPQAMGGGGGIVYAANQIFFISKAVNKNDEGVEGFRFTLTAEKSRYVREKSKFPFTVTFKDGINRWSALFDLAVSYGVITKPSMGWYQIIDVETGEVLGPKRRAKDIETDDAFFEGLIKDEKFKAYAESKFKLGFAGLENDEDENQVDQDPEDMDDEDSE
jgi:hypothetical protein